MKLLPPTGLPYDIGEVDFQYRRDAKKSVEVGCTQPPLQEADTLPGQTTSFGHPRHRQALFDAPLVEKPRHASANFTD